MIITYRPRMICTVLAILFEILVLLFVILGAALNLFKPMGRFGAWWGANTCYTMWGIAYCSNHKRINAPGNAWKGFPCKATRDHINAAAAFTIFAIFLAVVTLVLTVLLLTSFGNKLYALIAAVVCCVSTLVAWACVVGGYYFDCHNNYWGWNGGMSLSSNFHYGDAFGLLVAAWVLQIIQAILLYLSGWSYGIHHTTVVGTQKSAPASSQKSTTVVTTQRAAPASTQKSTFVVKTAPASTQKTTTTTVVGTQQKAAPVVTQKTTTTTVVTTTRK